MAAPVSSPSMSETLTTCYRHPDRRAGVACQRCGKPICPSCMVQASVGFHCPDCAKGSGQKVYNAQTVRRLNQPVVTIGLIIVNTIVFVADQLLANRAFGGHSLSDLGSLVAVGQYDNGSGLVGVATGEWWRVITAGFLHENIIHLGLNMVCLWIVGSQLERALGRWRYSALYVTSLLAGSLLALVIDPFIPGLGASGAIFGLFGVAFIYQRSIGINPFRSGIGTLIIINLVFSFAVPGVSWAAHIGGLVGGSVAAIAMFALERRVKSAAVGIALCSAICVGLVIASIIVANNALASL
jgi:membrane associated rhomboid family serine protease